MRGAVSIRNIESGDIIFRNGFGVEGRLLKNQKWTHVGLVYTENNTPYVIHAYPGPDGHSGTVRQEFLSDFVHKDIAKSYKMYRLKYSSAVDRQAAVTWAVSHIGAPFDYTYTNESETAFYCTAFVWKAVRVGGIDLCPVLPPPSNYPFIGVRSIILPGLLLSSEECYV